MLRRLVRYPFAVMGFLAFGPSAILAGLGFLFHSHLPQGLRAEPVLHSPYSYLVFCGLFGTLTAASFYHMWLNERRRRKILATGQKCRPCRVSVVRAPYGMGPPNLWAALLARIAGLNVTRVSYAFDVPGRVRHEGHGNVVAERGTTAAQADGEDVTRRVQVCYDEANPSWNFPMLVRAETAAAGAEPAPADFTARRDGRPLGPFLRTEGVWLAVFAALLAVLFVLAFVLQRQGRLPLRGGRAGAAAVIVSLASILYGLYALVRGCVRAASVALGTTEVSGRLLEDTRLQRWILKATVAVDIAAALALATLLAGLLGS